jgi:hypothetical protein
MRELACPWCAATDLTDDLEIAESFLQQRLVVGGRHHVILQACSLNASRAEQVAISLVLLVGAGLFFARCITLRRVDVGFNPRNLLPFCVNPQLNRYDEKRMPAL